VLNLGDMKVDGYLEPILLGRAGSANEALARYTFPTGVLKDGLAVGEHPNVFRAENFPPVAGGPSGFISGSLYGPEATEFGATFSLLTNAAAGKVFITGVTAGSKAP
jgi:hypothetical protein